MQDEADFTRLMFAQEAVKMLPFADVWEEYLVRSGLKEDYYTELTDYEKKILKERS